MSSSSQQSHAGESSGASHTVSCFSVSWHVSSGLPAVSWAPPEGCPVSSRTPALLSLSHPVMGGSFSLGRDRRVS